MKISVTDLALVSECKRCFWYAVRGVKRPQIFPSILKSLDELIKLDVTRRTRNRERLSFTQGGVVVTGVNKRMMLAHSGGTLVGVIDELVKFRDGYKVIDYKVSANAYTREKADHYYGVQMSAYALLCEENGYEPVTRADLVFYVPVEMVSGVVTFEIVVVPMTITIHRVETLLQNAREIGMMSTPPEDGGDCKWCRYVKSRSREGIENKEEVTDG